MMVPQATSQGPGLKWLSWWYGWMDVVPVTTDDEELVVECGGHRYTVLRDLSPRDLQWRMEILQDLEQAGVAALPRPAAGPGGRTWVEMAGGIYSLWIPGEAGVLLPGDGGGLGRATGALVNAFARHPGPGSKMEGRYGSWVAAFRRSLSALEQSGAEEAEGVDSGVVSAFLEEGQRALALLEAGDYRRWSERARENHLWCFGRWRLETLATLWEKPGVLRSAIRDLPLYDAASLAENLMITRPDEWIPFLDGLRSVWQVGGWDPQDMRAAETILEAYLRFPHRWPLLRTDPGAASAYAAAWAEGLSRLPAWSDHAV